MSARDDNNFLEMLRALPIRGATPRVVDLSYGNLLYGPEKTWPHPETVEEFAQADAVRSRRKQGLPERLGNAVRVVGLLMGSK
jgi:hypothetical protein